ncbi:MAG: MarR family transcriptional regulator [Acidobacteria bacterium]|nr:MAG: MarR family transcriptional regulator [Acidobacteriota bacterium]
MTRRSTKPDVTLADYRALAEFRYELRRYLALSDQAARFAGLHPGQYRFLLMLKGLPDGIEPTIGNLAERLGLRHHSTVELVDRLEKRGFIYRERNERHRSFVFVRIAPKGESILRKIVASRKVDLKKAGPVLVEALNTLIKNKGGKLKS